MQQLYIVNLLNSQGFHNNYVGENMQDQVLCYAVNSNPVVILDYVVMMVWQVLIFMEIAVKVCHFDMGEERSGMSECCLRQDF